MKRIGKDITSPVSFHGKADQGHGRNLFHRNANDIFEIVLRILPVVKIDIGFLLHNIERVDPIDS